MVFELYFALFVKDRIRNAYASPTFPQSHQPASWWFCAHKDAHLRLAYYFDSSSSMDRALASVSTD